MYGEQRCKRQEIEHAVKVPKIERKKHFVCGNEFAVKPSLLSGASSINGRVLTENNKRNPCGIPGIQIHFESKFKPNFDKNVVFRCDFRDTGISQCALALQDRGERRTLDRARRPISWSGGAIPFLGPILGACRTRAVASEASFSTFLLPSLPNPLPLRP